MADVKISNLPASTTPLAGTEVLPIVQSGTTKQVSVDNLTAGKSVSAASFVPTSATVPTNGMFLGAANSVSVATNSVERWMVNASGNLNPVGSYGIGTTAAIVNGVVSNTVQAIAAATQDSVKLQGRAGGTNSYTATITPTTLSGSRTVTLPDANTTLPVATQVLTFSGPSAARTITLPDANFTAARTDAAQSFTGDQTLSTGNLIQGTAAKGFNFTANSSAAGMSSQLLNYYEEGTWTPTQGAGLTVVGAFSSGGRYTRIGRQVTITGFVSGATSVAAASLSAICGGLPFATIGSSPVSSGVANSAKPEINSVYISSSTNSLIAVNAMAATNTINFTVTYFV